MTGRSYLGGVLLCPLLARLHRKTEQTRWRGSDIVVAFLRLVTPWCLGVGCAWTAVLALPLGSAYRHDLDHALLAVIVVVVSTVPRPLITERRPWPSAGGRFRRW
jgi:hypothetical protein